MFSALSAVVFLGSATTTEAQGRRGPARRVVVVGGFYASPYWLYDPWYAGQWGPYGYGYQPYRRYLDPEASVRLEVKPTEAEVYVDGYYAGIVDDFDGVFQRLRAAPGAHEITVFLDGYRTLTERVYLMPNATLKIKRTLDRLGPGGCAGPPDVGGGVRL